MKLEKIIIVFMAFFIGLAFVYLFTKSSHGDVNVTAEAPAGEQSALAGSAAFESKSTGSMGSGDALVELTPVAVDRERIVLKFNINTHSVRLSAYDLKQITTLEYSGKALKPVRAGRMGGHHSSGTIEFETGEEVGSFTIRIKGIPRVEERVFKWSV